LRAPDESESIVRMARTSTRWAAIITLFTVGAGCGPGGIVNDPMTSADVNESRSLAVRGCSMPGCGSVLASWDGTDAYSNGEDTGTGNSCADRGRYGYQYQCVELVMRHFSRKWGLSWSGHAKALLDNAPRGSVDVYMNGDAAHPPVPGDMLVWTGGDYGHVVLVTNVTATEVEAIEQNYCGSGRLRMSYSGGRVGARRPGGAEPAGWAHAKANSAGGSGVPPVSTPPVACSGSASGMSSVWTCTADRSSRQRCVSGMVQTEACPSPCETRPTGQDDVCGTAAPACGASGQSCCSGTTCNAGLSCQSGQCMAPPACGASGQACCGGTSCNAGLTCQSGRCATAMMPPACGAEGQSCCSGTTCNAGLSCTGGTCARSSGGVIWDCNRSAYNGAQYWTCGTDAARYRCASGVAQREACSGGCFSRATGQDDLCAEVTSGWDCNRSASGGAQYWTCSSGSLYRCESGAPRIVRCPSGCASRPVGTNDVCN
jgi:hypothetical protein